MNIIKVKVEDNNSRLDRFLRRHVGEINQSLLEKYLRQKFILLDDKKAKASQRVQLNQVISYSSSILFSKNKTEPTFSNQEKKIYENLYSKIIVKENKNFIAINKPNDIAVQGGTKQRLHIDNFLRVNFEKSEIIPKLVHRLDKETSGLLIIAKDSVNARKISQFFRNGKIMKIYYALVSPPPLNDKGIIKTNIGKRKSFTENKMFVSADIGKSSMTKYVVIDKIDREMALVALYPITGRTHQLRLHMNHIGSPIIGDKKYFKNDTNYLKNDKDKFLKLHAAIIKIPDENLLKADMPKHFKNSLEYYGLNLKKDEYVYNLFREDKN